MVEGTKGSHHKEGTTKMANPNTTVAGIDTAKHKLDAAIHGLQQRWTFDNSPAGRETLVALMRQHEVTRIGIEATGGYERDIVAHLRREGFAVVVLQPLQVRAFAQLTLCRAKNDRIDAGLIAACTAQHGGRCEPSDPRLAGLADILTFIEQTEEDIARIKVRLEHTRNADLRRTMLDDIARLKQRRATMIAKLAAAVRRHDDLGRRLDLVISIDGIAARTGLALVIRMPELGRVSREQIASLAGLAPFVHQSGKRKGESHIGGGRQRPRRSLYAAALPAAFRWNPHLVALYRRLTAAGKPHKVALVACARKLLVFANTVLARGTPWTKSTVAP
jgi:transposase